MLQPGFGGDGRPYFSSGKTQAQPYYFAMCVKILDFFVPS
jgi:hypothetical protein